MFTKLFNKINQSLIVESLLSSEIDALKEPKQNHFTPEDLYQGSPPRKPDNSLPR